MPIFNNKTPTTNVDQYAEYIRATTSMPEHPVPFEEIRQHYYRFKLLDCIWFDGDLPQNPTEAFLYYLNTNWPSPELLPDAPDSFHLLTEAELRYICKKLKRPKWIDRTSRKRRISFMDFIQNWSNL